MAFFLELEFLFLEKDIVFIKSSSKNIVIKKLFKYKK